MIESTSKLLKIVAVYFAPSSSIDSIVQNGQNATVNFLGDEDWEEIKFTAASYAEPSKETDNGIIYNQLLRLMLAGDDILLQKRVFEIISSKPIFRFEYDNEVSKIMGDTQNYVKLLPGFSSEGFTTKNELSLARQSHQPALFLTI